MKRTYQYKWRRTIKWLRLAFPPNHPVKLRTIALKNLCGDTRFDSKFTIRVNKHDPFRVKLDTLIHEWAHVLSWFVLPEIDDHSGEWGLAYARIYRAFIRWNYGKGDK